MSSAAYGPQRPSVGGDVHYFEDGSTSAMPIPRAGKITNVLDYDTGVCDVVYQKVDPEFAEPSESAAITIGCPHVPFSASYGSPRTWSWPPRV